MDATVAPSARSQAAPSETDASPPAVEPREKLRRLWEDPSGFIGWFRATSNDSIGTRMIGTAFIFFLLGGIIALLIRTQLAVPDNTFLSPEVYNQLFTMHGSTMMYLFAVPILEGFAIVVLPMLLGAREMPFPRLSAFSLYAYAFGAILLYLSFAFGEVPENGWFAYVPLSSEEFSPGRGMDFWLMGLSLVELSGIVAGAEIVMVILGMRAPGMSISRMPLFAWAMLVTALAFIFAFTPLLVASVMLTLDRSFDTQFYDAALGGSPLLWQHLFWIFGHPEVYIQFIPATGIVSMIVPVFARRPIVGYAFVAMSIVATGTISFGLWVHHMFTVGLPQVGMAFFTAASMTIAIPSGVQIFAWISTILQGRSVWKTPFLFVIGFIVIFVLGGITGVMVASVPFDTQVHDSFFVVAHFHYVLIGGVVFPIFAGLYYWLPKFTGKMLDEGLGRWNFWLLFIGFNVTFFPMHIVGMLGMPRRVYTYQAETQWGTYNLIETAGAYLIAISVLIFVYNFARSMFFGKPAGDNPWNANTLEWASSSPQPPYGYQRIPIVHSRDPLWVEDVYERDGGRMERIVQILTRWPLNWRAGLATSVVEGRPVEVFGLPQSSIWPFVAAFGLFVFFASQVWKLYWVSLGGILIFLLAWVIWMWPQRLPMSEMEAEALSKEYGITIRPGGSSLISRGGTWLGIAVLGAGVATLIFSYLFIRLENAQWPPASIPLPDLLLPSLSIAALIASGGGIYWAMRNIRRNNVIGLWFGLSSAFVLAAGSLALLGAAYAGLDYDWTIHAYASLFYLSGWFLMALVAGGLGMNALIQIWAWRGYYSARRHIAVEVLSLYWYAMIVIGVTIFVMLYLTPYWV